MFKGQTGWRALNSHTGRGIKYIISYTSFSFGSQKSLSSHFALFLPTASITSTNSLISNSQETRRIHHDDRSKGISRGNGIWKGRIPAHSALAQIKDIEEEMAKTQVSDFHSRPNAFTDSRAEK